MSLTNDLLSQFVKVTNDNAESKIKSGVTVYGTVVKNGNNTYVKMDGSDIVTPIDPTPVDSVTDAKNEDRVMITINNHKATITGNITSPSARKEVVDVVYNKVESYDSIIATKATIEQLNATEADIKSLVADKADITTLEADKAEITELIATKADITTLEADKAEITELVATKLSADDIEGKYANIDFSNITKETVKDFYAESGIIDNATLKDGEITGELKGVTIRGDSIIANTLKADSLILSGTDGLYYKLNVTSLGEAVVEKDTTGKYEDGLDGSVIIAKSITADQISVSDLVAFGAKIAGYTVTSSALYSGSKTSVSNTTRGVYLDSDGQIAFGDSSKYVKFYKNSSGNGVLEIKTDKFTLDANGNAYFKGDITGASGSFSGSLNGATGTFSGSLNSASGTFTGAIRATEVFIRSDETVASNDCYMYIVSGYGNSTGTSFVSGKYNSSYGYTYPILAIGAGRGASGATSFDGSIIYVTSSGVIIDTLRTDTIYSYQDSRVFVGNSLYVNDTLTAAKSIYSSSNIVATGACISKSNNVYASYLEGTSANAGNIYAHMWSDKTSTHFGSTIINDDGSTAWCYGGLYFYKNYTQLTGPSESGVYVSVNSTSSTQGLLTLGRGYSSSYTSAYRAYWKDNSIHNMLERNSDGLSCYLGWAGSSSYSTITQIRGRTCKYQNSSGTTTLSDRNLKINYDGYDTKYDIFFDNLRPTPFKYINGNSGRKHLGYITQEVEDALTTAGLSTVDFGGVNIIPISNRETEYDNDGNTIDIEGSSVNYLLDLGIHEEHDLIYTEFISLNTWQIQKVKSRTATLEEKVVELEQKCEELQLQLQAYINGNYELREVQ